MDTSLLTQDGTLESPESAGKGKSGVVKRWMLEISLADKLESPWRKTGNGARDIYRGKKKSQNSFNILWANTEVIRPNLYNSTPVPDVRRRYRDADPQGKQVSEVLERALAFETDACDFDGTMESSVFDSVLPGRGAARIRFEPYYEEQIDPVTGEPTQTLAGAKTYPEPVEWDMWRRGPASKWSDLPWLAYEHLFTMEEVKKKFPGFEKRVQYDVVIKGASEEASNAEPTVYKRVRVWEIWDKDDRKILWIAPSLEEEPLLEEDDKLGLKDFFDMPKPLYAVDDTSSLEPICEYSLYEEQAKELNRVTQRINKLTEALKVRGVYDSTLAEMSKLLESSDNDMIPTEDATIALQAGGFDKAIWLFPLDQLAKALAQLYVQREQIKMTIYEVIGISDILRGSSDPNETLGAQELKAQTGSVRLQRRQRDVQRFARDLFRLMAEVIAEHYPPELLSIMTGVQVTDEMKNIMQRDLLRGTRVDVETDSTIAADQSKTRRDVSEVMEAVGGFVESFGPAVQTGAVSMEAAKKILLSIIRKAKLGRDVEDAIEQDAEQPQQPKPDPEMEKAQAEIKLKQDEAAAKIGLQREQAQANHTLQDQKIKSDAEQGERQAQREYELAVQKMEFEHIQKMRQIEIDNELREKQMERESQIKREQVNATAHVNLEGKRMMADVAKTKGKKQGEAK